MARTKNNCIEKIGGAMCVRVSVYPHHTKGKKWVWEGSSEAGRDENPENDWDFRFLTLWLI